MYRAKNGFTLKSTDTPFGWKIKRGEDIILALEALPGFETVAACFIVEAIDQAIKDRKEHEDITDLANYLNENYI